MQQNNLVVQGYALSLASSSSSIDVVAPRFEYVDFQQMSK